MRKIFISSLISLLLPLSVIKCQEYLNTALSDSARAADLLGRMSKEEKIGQMIQGERGTIIGNPSLISTCYLGSVLSGGGSSPSPNTVKSWVDMYNNFQGYALKTRLKIPIIYGIDAVHGHNNVYGATIFPHNIGLGCTRDTQLVRRCAEITATEVSATGLDWTFSPCIAVVRDIRWGRTYEGFGESPEVVSPMAKASVTGYQYGKYPIMACAKHFLGDGGTRGGNDQGNSEYTESELRALFLPPYKEAVDAGVSTIMVSFSSWNGEKMHGNEYLITEVLKNELGFKGFVVSDWAGINQLNDNYPIALQTAINAGIDMVMDPYSPENVYSTMLSLVNSQQIPMDRIDDAVMRILMQKFRFGLFENPYTDSTLADSVGSDAHRAVAREAVRKSLVVLKNLGALPIKKDASKIFVCGSKANDLGSQCGGWTITWQGKTGNLTIGTTFLQAVKEVATGNVVYSNDVAEATGSDVAIVVAGETPYAEGGGDDNDLSLLTMDVDLVNDLNAEGIPVVVVLYSGRPLIIKGVIENTDAFVAAWLPGTEGRGITDVLFGDYQPVGKLSQSWPRFTDQLPLNYGNWPYDAQFEYNYGVADWDIHTYVEENTVDNSIDVFPNPATDYFNISTGIYMNTASIKIFDNLGRLILSKEGIDFTPWSVIPVNIKILGKGGYNLVVENKDKVLHSRIVVK